MKEIMFAQQENRNNDLRAAFHILLKVFLTVYLEQLTNAYHQSRLDNYVLFLCIQERCEN